MRHLLTSLIVLLAACSASAQELDPTTLHGEWTACGFYADMDGVQSIDFKQGNSKCNTRDCAFTTWRFLVRDGEQILEREINMGCADSELQVSEEGAFGSWSFDPITKLLTIEPYFEGNTLHFEVSNLGCESFSLATWAPAN